MRYADWSCSVSCTFSFPIYSEAKSRILQASISNEFYAFSHETNAQLRLASIRITNKHKISWVPMLPDKDGQALMENLMEFFPHYTTVHQKVHSNLLPRYQQSGKRKVYCMCLELCICNFKFQKKKITALISTKSTISCS